MVNAAEDSAGSAADGDSTNASTHASGGFMEFLQVLIENQRLIIADSQNIQTPAAVDTTAPAVHFADEESVLPAVVDTTAPAVHFADEESLLPAVVDRTAPAVHFAHEESVSTVAVGWGGTNWVRRERDTVTERIMKREKKKTHRLRYETSANYVIILRFRYTILDYILRDPLFYVTMLVYILVRVGDNLYERATGEVMNGEAFFPSRGSFDVIGTFMSFILTFFVDQTLSGYQGAYERCMKAKGEIIDFAQKGGVVLPKERVTRIVRHLNAAHLVGYAALTHGHYKDDFIVPLNEEMNLLTSEEMAKLNGLKNAVGPRYCFQIVMWILKDLKQACEMNEIDGDTMSELMSLAQDFRRSMAAHFNAINIPTVSFFYFHLISLLCVVYLPLFAAHEALACSVPPDITSGFYPSDIIQVSIVIIQSIYVIGMRIVALKLMNPYEEDVEDLPLLTFIRAAWCMSEQTLRIAEDEEELMANPVAWNKSYRRTLLKYPVENKIG